MNDYIKNTCKIGQGSACCRYLAAGAEGFECLKLSNLKQLLDNRVKNNTIVAQSDNCDGIDGVIEKHLNEQNGNHS